jgi:alkylation response protein AidB-like acyl-CoA dehydrogenase
LPCVHADGYGPAVESIIDRARAIAEDVLFPAALGTDASDLLPATHLDLLAHQGFYGIAGPPEAGWMNLDSSTTSEVVEALASGCLTTAFVWL